MLWKCSQWSETGTGTRTLFPIAPVPFHVPGSVPPVQCDFTIRRQENGRDIHTDTMNTIDKKISPNFQEKEVISQRSDCKAKSVV